MAEEAAKPRRKGLFKKILIGFVVILAVFAGIVALQPADYKITRSATM